MESCSNGFMAVPMISFVGHGAGAYRQRLDFLRLSRCRIGVGASKRKVSNGQHGRMTLLCLLLFNIHLSTLGHKGHTAGLQTVSLSVSLRQEEWSQQPQ